MRKPKVSILNVEKIAVKINNIRGVKVTLDSDLALLYGVETKVLNRSVKRNIKRFPEDFMFKLSKEELESLRCQIGTSNDKSLPITKKVKWGGRRYLSYAFTENGVAMLSSVLRSDKAIKINIEIMRTFTKLRYILATNSEVKEKIKELEERVGKHDEQLRILVEEIRDYLKKDEEVSKAKIGFRLRMMLMM
jgi:phage regulator Rha-like protein